MNKRYCIFDMDGTLTDSMHFWKDLGRDYLHQKGISPDENLLWMVKTMTMRESAAYFIQTFGLPGSTEQVVQEMEAIMEHHYRTDVPLKPGVMAYLNERKAQGARLCVATATAEPLAWDCLRRLGAADAFEFLLSCETIGLSKEQPALFLMAAERFAAPPSEIAVYEDALYAARTAKQAGFYTVGVQEKSYAADWTTMLSLCDETITDWRCAL